MVATPHYEQLDCHAQQASGIDLRNRRDDTSASIRLHRPPSKEVTLYVQDTRQIITSLL